jgi:predicted AlkP superfamily phosphohydrolase/phosphomutase
MTKEMQSTLKPRLVVIGLDGATFDVIDPWVEQGHLPNIAELMATGTRGQLMSTVPAISPAAWAAFMTGQNPGKTGVSGFAQIKAGKYQLEFVNGGRMHGATMWGDMNRAGYTTGVLNVPMTYPPQPIDGFMVSGVDTPDTSVHFTHPAELAQELSEHLGEYIIDLRHDDRSGTRDDYDAVIRGIMHALKSRRGAVEYLLQRHPVDVFVAVFTAPDRAGHMLWHLNDTCHPMYNPELASRYGDAHLRVYQEIDTAIGVIRRAVPPHCTLVLLSDHGMGPLHKEFDLNRWLQKEGLLVRAGRAKQAFAGCVSAVVRKSWSVLPRRLKRAVRQRCPELRERTASMLGFTNVDWSRTKAFAIAEQVYINQQGVFPQGCVAPGEEYQRFREQLLAIRDPGCGETLLADVKLAEEVYNGPHLNVLGDLVAICKDHYSARLPIAETFHDFVAPPASIEGTSIVRTGGHRPNGIFIAAGPGIRTGHEIAGARIVDVAPSLLLLLGISAPENMDGECLGEMFTEDFLSAQQVEEVPEAARESRRSPYSEEEKEAIEKRLKDLGYM